MPYYPSAVNIGGAYGTTWGTLRSPIYNGSGFMGRYPESDNIGKDLISLNPYFLLPPKFNSEYAKPVTDICKIMSVWNDYNPDYPASAVNQSGGCLGCNAWMTGQTYDPEPEGYKVRVYLACGSGYYQHINGTPDLSYSPFEYPRDEAYTSSTYETPMDTPSLRETFVGAIVNVTIRLGWGYGETTHDVIVTEELFPDDPYGRGQLFLEVILPFQEENPPPPWQPSQFWTINSVTLPS